MIASVTAAAVTTDTLAGSCGRAPGSACRLVWDLTHNGSAARLTGSFLAGPVTVGVRIVFVLALAFVIRSILHRVISRVSKRAAEGPAGPAAAGRAARPERSGQRRRQRAHALGSILRNTSSIVIFGIAGITILGELGINLAPVLASAGVLGVALGFGAQSLVGDFLNGISMLLEDQYGVGDVITAGTTTGTVEAVGLRATRLRDVNGVVWHIRNGSIQQVGNQSQGWARAVVDVPVPYNQDMTEIREVITQAAERTWSQPEWEEVILEQPSVWGVQSLSSSEVTWRVAAMTTPPRQYEVERELREKIKEALDARGITTAPTVVALAATQAPQGPDAGRVAEEHAS